MPLKTVSLYVLTSAVVGLLVFSLSVLASIRSGRHLTDIRVRITDVSPDVFQGISVELISQYGGVKTAVSDSMAKEFLGCQLGPISRIECLLSGKSPESIPGDCSIEILQVSRSGGKHSERAIRRIRASNIVWTPLDLPVESYRADLVTPLSERSVGSMLTRTMGAVNSVGMWRLALRCVRHGILSGLAVLLAMLSLQREDPVFRISDLKASEVFPFCDESNSGMGFLSDRYSAWMLLTGWIVAVIVFRDPRVFLYPSMTWEDGMFYCFSLNNFSITNVVHFNNGYMPLTPNLFAMAAQLLPVQAVPYAYAAFGLFLALVQHVCFFHRYFRRFVASDFARFCGCVAMGCIPFSSAHQVSNVAYATWQQLFLIVLFAASGFRCQTRLGNVSLWLFMFLGVWSNPLSIVLLGTIGLLCFERRSGDRFLISLTAAAVLYQLLGIDSGAQEVQVNSAAAFLKCCAMGALHLLNSVSVGILGQDAYMYALSIHSGIVLGVGCCIVLWIVVVVLRRRQGIPFFCIFAMSCLALSVGSYMGRGDLIMDIRDSPRYAYVTGSFAALMVGVFFGEWLSGSNIRRNSVHGKRFHFYFVVLAIGFTLICNVKCTTYLADVQNGMVVRDFFADLSNALAGPPSSRRDLSIVRMKVAEPELVARFDSEGLPGSGEK